MPQRSAVFIYTTFPVPTETFLRRELRSLANLGFLPRLASVWQGAPSWEDRPVLRMEARHWLSLLWKVPRLFALRPRIAFPLLGRLFQHLPPSLENLLENLAGFGAAIAWEDTFREEPADHFHAAWASGAASAAWLLARLLDRTWSTGAHAYDVYRDGGDWLLPEKLRAAAFVQCSTAMAASRVIALGAEPAHTVFIRRGLNAIPPLRPAPTPGTALRIIHIARFVPKKGHSLLLDILAAASDAGIQYSITVVGDGPLRPAVEAAARRRGLAARIRFAGALDEHATARELADADILLHTGIVTANGDRDGLPNVIGEAMAAGVVVLASPAAAVTEAVEHGWNGLLANPADPAAWVTALTHLRDDPPLRQRLRAAAHAWASAHYDANLGAVRLRQALNAAITRANPTPTEAPDTPLPPSRSARRRRRKRDRPARTDEAREQSTDASPPRDVVAESRSRSSLPVPGGFTPVAR